MCLCVEQALQLPLAGATWLGDECCEMPRLRLSGTLSDQGVERNPGQRGVVHSGSNQSLFPAGMIAAVRQAPRVVRALLATESGYGDSETIVSTVERWSVVLSHRETKGQLFWPRSNKDRLFQPQLATISFNIGLVTREVTSQSHIYVSPARVSWGRKTSSRTDMLSL